MAAPSPQAENPLARHFTLCSLIRFATPGMAMTLLLSLYTIVDGIFIARCAGTLALSAVNMFFPLMGIVYGIAFMLAAGGSALIARRMGEGDMRGAQRMFSALVGIVLALGLGFASAGYGCAPQLAQLLGATPAQLADCIAYMRPFFLFAPVVMLQVCFQTFFTTAGHPGLGLASITLAGITNVVLDYVFMVPLQMGVAGAALATGCGALMPAAIGLAFFLLRRGDCLRFTAPAISPRDFLHTCWNGASEMVTNLANSVTGYLYNITFIRLLGEDGVAALTVVFYFEFIFSSVFFGYANGVAPVISYKYGEGNRAQLRLIIRRSLLFVLLFSILAYLLSVGTLDRTLPIFLPPESPVYALAHAGFRPYALAFLLMGVGIFASSAFTALSNGTVSALISFGRTFVFLAGSIVLLPRLMGAEGLWLAMPAAEALGLLLAAACLILLRRRYGY